MHRILCRGGIQFPPTIITISEKGNFISNVARSYISMKAIFSGMLPCRNSLTFFFTDFLDGYNELRNVCNEKPQYRLKNFQDPYPIQQVAQT
ncbi:uncharacterized protein GVI51_F04169 [Nakaseomyces glabratus]|uniref:Uncharacterized protein n=1 Tax=Candida glabrata (strain ATCC 2001 / BCRC 20586 / JCM 3761 / NBRC 0622 / NRRL Y-65 / CBS 138) TaxID=284593 RepID=Q6FUC5_CANGA|nr:uncharacterized protein CAGL0F04543g [Nakaseomyces glabratus]KAH7605127.1 hypothetical protein J7294_01420 [Nakaseomyces glabratus]KAH7607443.1 hypothetical protein J7293_01419 [Nakaseomyces glabratus]QHS65799.1 uncharacterized protein GVI51_F04169 [Nakaseomyces glabratus]CAG59093.1 unnamed protein product [Nakaseomyces glabratus]|eukprot:XP_446169.1 uncharacterized protein CAGL0F04543g [[Candida] glabrata]